MKYIENKTFDEERALYGEKGLCIKGCVFDGPADGESALKECSDIQVEDSYFNLRYPFWHNHTLKISSSKLTPMCRAALWYSDHIKITKSELHGIKACLLYTSQSGAGISFIISSKSSFKSELGCSGLYSALAHPSLPEA